MVGVAQGKKTLLLRKVNFKMSKVGKPEKLIVKGKRLDGRAFDELRPLKIKAGVIKTADGSAYIELGKTKILVAVYGPKNMYPRRLTEQKRAYLNTYYNMMAFSTTDRAKPGYSRRSIEISKVMSEALAPAIMLEKYPQTRIDVAAEVINSHAGTRTAAITAAAVALADAGIELKDLVTSIAVGKADGELLLDLFNPEDNFGEADLAIAIMPRTKQITLMQGEGTLNEKEIKEMLKMAKKAIAHIYEEQKKALRERIKR